MGALHIFAHLMMNPSTPQLPAPNHNLNPETSD